MSDAAASLLERRLLIVTGKGGAGKTAVVAALGLIAASRGVDAVLVELAGESRLSSRVAPDPAAVQPGDGRVPVPLAPHLFSLCIDPLVALTEYLELQLRLAPLARALVSYPGLRPLLSAAPGWRDLITLGKIWHLHTVGLATGRGRRSASPLLIVDAPATGHGLSLLSVPRVVIETVRMGPLRRHTDRVQELLCDAKRTLVIPVTLPEELGVNETGEMCRTISEMGLALGPVIANGVEAVPPVRGAGELASALADLRAPDLEVLPADGLRACLEDSLERGEEQRARLDELRQRVRGPVIELPHLATGIESREHAEELARQLEKGLAAVELET